MTIESKNILNHMTTLLTSMLDEMSYSPEYSYQCFDSIQVRKHLQTNFHKRNKVPKKIHH